MYQAKVAATITHEVPSFQLTIAMEPLAASPEWHAANINEWDPRLGTSGAWRCVALCHWHSGDRRIDNVISYNWGMVPDRATLDRLARAVEGE